MFCWTHSPYSTFPPLSIFGGWSCGCAGVEERQIQHLLRVNGELLFWDTSNSLSYGCHGREIRVGLLKWKSAAFSLEIRAFSCNSWVPATSDAEHGLIKKNRGYFILFPNIQPSPFKVPPQLFQSFLCLNMWRFTVLQSSLFSKHQ